MYNLFLVKFVELLDYIFINLLNMDNSFDYKDFLEEMWSLCLLVRISVWERLFTSYHIVS